MISEYYVYLIRNLVNGKVYVRMRRLREGEDAWSFDYAGSGKLLHLAYAKYGIENFSKEVLVGSIPTRELACEVERYYVRAFESTDRARGYNLTRGGDCGAGHAGGVPLSSRHREALSLAKRGNSNRAKPVVRLNDGRVVESACEAARESGTNPSAVGACCAGLRRDAGGTFFAWHDPMLPAAYYESEGERLAASKPFGRVAVVR